MAQVCESTPIRPRNTADSSHRLQKALKAQASRNAATLKRTHLIALGVNASFLLLRLLFFRRRRLLPFLLLTSPALFFEFWFERIGRPVHTDTPHGPELKKAGEDLEAPGLTEWMWDVVYWTWANTVLVAFVGDWAWWLYLVVPAYSAWLAFSTYTGMRRGLGGMMGPGAAREGEGGGQSKRQAKMEKRGGQKVAYR